MESTDNVFHLILPPKPKDLDLLQASDLNRVTGGVIVELSDNLAMFSRPPYQEKLQ